jgi:proteasome lid subunit RPN8/RPN11
MVLKIKKDHIEFMFQNSRETAPVEACGILVGKRSCGEKTVERVIPAKNVVASPIAYEIDAEEILRAFEEAERAGQEVIGFFHSHPLHEPFWSAEDEKKSEYWSGYSFLILSLKTGDFKCYLKAREKQVEEEEVVIT